MKANLVTVLVALLMLQAPACAVEQGEEGMFKIYGQYEKVNPPQPTEDPKRVEVLELFWYGCPYCYQFEPHLNAWLKKMPANVVFKRMPTIFRKSWEIHARAFYTAQMLGVDGKTHSALFHAMHKDRQRMNTENALRKFCGKHGVSEKDFNDTFRSFAVDAKVRRARVMGQRYGIRGVPSVVVNGKYRVNGTSAGGNHNIMKVVDFLIKKESNSQRK